MKKKKPKIRKRKFFESFIQIAHFKIKIKEVDSYSLYKVEVNDTVSQNSIYTEIEYFELVGFAILQLLSDLTLDDGTLLNITCEVCDAEGKKCRRHTNQFFEGEENAN